MDRLAQNVLLWRNGDAAPQPLPVRLVAPARRYRRNPAVLAACYLLDDAMIRAVQIGHSIAQGDFVLAW